MNMRLLLAAGGFLSACLAPAWAELPPKVYLDLQKNAAEVLKIRADEVESKPKGLLDRSSYTETVKATVLDVERSKSGTRKGDVITIIYQRDVPKEGFVGPSPAPQLKTGGVYTGYLGKTAEGTFAISARGMSFSKMAD